MTRLWAVIGAAALVTAGAACSSTTGTTGAPEGHEAPAAASANTEYPVGQDQIVLVDESRPTAADPQRHLAARPDRTITVTLLYPARGEPGNDRAPVPGAAVASGDFPLVVFSHGVTGTGDSYQRRLRNWAAAGYIIAAPTYPLTSGRGAHIDDVVSQPGDVTFVIDELLARAHRPDDALYRHLDTEHIGVAGHSLGAITTIGVTFNSCCHDARVDAAVEISGIALPFPNGDYANWPATPLLAVHGARDTIIPVTGSDRLVAQARSPAYYLRLSGGDHLSLLYGDNGALVDETVIAFLDRYLQGDPEPLNHIPARVRRSELATFDAHTSEQP